MALTEKELSIAQQIKEQGGSRDDFLEVLEQYRSQQGQVTAKETNLETPEGQARETKIQIEESPMGASAVGLASMLGQGQFEPTGTVEEEAKEPRRHEQGGEFDEGLKGLISETAEAWEDRGVEMQKIKERYAKNSQELGSETSEDAFKQLGLAGQAAFQLLGQIAGGGGDLAGESVENLIQDFTPEVAESALQGAVDYLAETKGVESVANMWMNFEKENPNVASDIAGVANLVDLLGIKKNLFKKTLKEAKKPFSETVKEVGREAAEQKLKKIGTAIFNPSKVFKGDVNEITKFMVENAGEAVDFEGIAKNIAKKGDDAIKGLDIQLSDVKVPIKGDKLKDVVDVLDVMVKKAEGLDLGKDQFERLRALRQKATKGEGLTLSEINSVKRDINKYISAWSKSGIASDTLNAGIARDKYKKVMSLIEEEATKAGITDVKKLNQDWAKASQVQELLSPQILKIDKKEGLDILKGQQVGKIAKVGQGIRSTKRKFGLTEFADSFTPGDIDVPKMLKGLDKVIKDSNQKTVQKNIGGFLEKFDKAARSIKK